MTTRWTLDAHTAPAREHLPAMGNACDREVEAQKEGKESVVVSRGLFRLCLSDCSRSLMRLYALAQVCRHYNSMNCASPLLQEPCHHPQQLTPTLPYDQPRPLQQKLGLLYELENHLRPVPRSQDTGGMVDADHPYCLSDRVDVTHGLRGACVNLWPLTLRL
jgi:hypothetical protein